MFFCDRDEGGVFEAGGYITLLKNCVKTGAAGQESETPSAPGAFLDFCFRKT